MLFHIHDPTSPTMTSPDTALELNKAWLSLIMQGTHGEIYLIDNKAQRIIQANRAATRNLQHTAVALKKIKLDHIFQFNTDSLSSNISNIFSAYGTTFSCQCIRRDHSTYPARLSIFKSPSNVPGQVIVICNDLTASLESAHALSASESRFRAIVSNTPGLVYQCLLAPDGAVSFPYLSAGCQPLLGITGRQLRAHPALFEQHILEEDRADYRATMAESAATLKNWNWEGRIHIEKWNDIKWINLRATPRIIAKQGIQWEGVMTNITQSKHEALEIKQSRAQLAELSAHIEHVKELERTHIAREVHDDLGGNLTAIKMALALLIRRLPANEAALIEKAQYVDSLADRSIESIHRIAADLRPSILDIGIVAALEWHTREFAKQSGISCRFHSTREDIDLAPESAAALFRVFQETLTNIGKHARASAVHIKLTLNRHCVSLIVTDDGCGIAAADQLKPKSFGIRGMVERAHALGGEFLIDALPQGGSRAKIKIPLSVSQQNTP
jgi:signal transduction histidine kinase